MSSNNLRNNVLDFAPTFGTQLTLDKEETAWVLARNSKNAESIGSLLLPIRE